MTPAAAAIISRWIFPGVVPLYASDVTRDRQKGLQRLGTRDLPSAATRRRAIAVRRVGVNTSPEPAGGCVSPPVCSRFRAKLR
ncbi:hypothetical protein F442_07389 [Phytophthora nicotianae P10297]|uniref:Uncharacterized protein n=2 Tax=Phytophthora nicotianae TaxID=4792 RepID=W2ZG75_PHYNI|nr:hypothetical protein F444_07393 [Phytophthora nicotianae P1976]ETP46352.1 hypothetical protein F442_07389 [Phytophthora nicotianae P10297]